MRDITGLKYGKLTVIEFFGRTTHTKQPRNLWKCKCDCGNERIVLANCLYNGDIKSCGCSRRINFYKGQIINNFQIKGFAESKIVKRKGTIHYWNCKCLLCGKSCIKSTSEIKNNKSCGCRQYIQKSRPKPRDIQANGTDTRINALLAAYKANARKRGIKFNLSYKEFSSIIQKDCYYCGDKPSNCKKIESHDRLIYNGIDRVNNNLGYQKGNCVPCCDFCNKAKRNVDVNLFYEKFNKIANRISKKIIKEVL